MSETGQHLTIVHIVTRWGRGGSEENTLLTMEDQLRRGYRVILVIGRDSDSDAISELPASIEVVKEKYLVHAISPVHDISSVLVCWRLIQGWRPDIVHTHQSKAGIVGRLAAWLAGVPAIVHTTHILPFLNVDAPKRWLYTFLERVVGGFTHGFIHVSEQMRSACADAHVGDQAQHRVILSGMAIDEFQTAGRDYPQIKTEGSPKVVLMVAADEPRKRHADLIKAFRAIVDTEPDAELWLAGVSGDSTLSSLISELELTSHVQLLGYRSDIPELIAKSNVCVLTSEREGLPRSVIQYVAVGRPVVCTSLPGIDAIVRHGHNGMLYEIGDVPALAQSILSILSDPVLQQQMGRYAQGIDLSPWSAEVMVDAIDRFMVDLVAYQNR